MLKRATDLAIATVLLIPALMICAGAAILIRADSRGPVLFVQTRLGRGQRTFRLYKLRTMSVETPNLASHHVSSSHITRVGGMLRRTKFDELPQLINVLKGEMSFVGPRPGLPSQHELTAEREKRGVFDVRPGITGLSQLAGIDMSTPAKLAEMDAHYVAKQSFRLDMKCLVQTATGGGRGDAVH